MCIDKFRVKGIQVVNIKNRSEIATFGIATLCGSNYETPDIAGISHFAEHMFFKGTQKRTWENIAKDLSMLGVSPNAYTNNNEVYYHSTFPKENTKGVIEVMLDMFFNSTFPEKELEKERSVIAEEKKSYDDDPRYDFSAKVLRHFVELDKSHDIIGTFETIDKISRNDIVNYLYKNLNFSNLLFVFCGDIDSEILKEYLESNMPDTHEYLKKGDQNILTTPLWNKLPKTNDIVKFKLEKENVSQAHITMMLQGISLWDDDAETVAVMCKSIGGGMYSNLFTRIREELGLCYSVGMQTYPFDYPHQTGVEIYGSLATENVDLFIEESEKIIANTIKDGVDKECFECAKVDILSTTLKLTETSAGKAAYHFRKLLLGNFDRENSIDKVRRVTIEDCNRVIEKIFNKENEHKWCLMVPKG